MGLGLDCEQRFGTASNSFGAFTAWELAVVQVELEKVEIFVPQLLPEEEVVSEATIQVFHPGTGANGRKNQRCQEPKYAIIAKNGSCHLSAFSQALP